MVVIKYRIEIFILLQKKKKYFGLKSQEPTYKRLVGG